MAIQEYWRRPPIAALPLTGGGGGGAIKGVKNMPNLLQRRTPAALAGASLPLPHVAGAIGNALSRINRSGRNLSLAGSLLAAALLNTASVANAQTYTSGEWSLSWLRLGEFLDDAKNVNDEKIREGEGIAAGTNIGVQFRVSTVVASPPSTIEVVVRSGSAKEGPDYDLTPFSRTAAHLGPSAGREWYQGFRISIIADNIVEGDEYFEVVVNDTAGNLLVEPFRVTIEADERFPIQKETAHYALARAEALIENQPRLIPMLREPDGRSEFNLRVTDGGVDADGGFQAETVWGETALSRTIDGDREHQHLLATLGAHFRMSERFHLGGMLQYDRSGMEPGGAGASGEIGGTGWMVGPYFAARDASHPLFFEGRLLYGRSSNDVEDLVLDNKARSGTFDSERWLAQARVEGTFQFGSRVTMIPLAELSHARDEMEPFLVSGNTIEGQTVALSQTVALTKFQIGAELEIPVDTARGDLLVRPGLRFVASDVSEGAILGMAGEKPGLRSRGRIDFGIDYRLDDGLVLGFDSFYSGLGRKDLESYGAGLDLRLEF